MAICSPPRRSQLLPLRLPRAGPCSGQGALTSMRRWKSPGSSSRKVASTPLLHVWAIRDQIVTGRRREGQSPSSISGPSAQDCRRKETGPPRNFGVWHLAWAISNVYRNGDGGIMAQLEGAHLDARMRPERLMKFKDAASEHINGNKVYMGDIHDAARLVRPFSHRGTGE